MDFIKTFIKTIPIAILYFVLIKLSIFIFEYLLVVFNIKMSMSFKKYIYVALTMVWMLIFGYIFVLRDKKKY